MTIMSVLVHSSQLIWKKLVEKCCLHPTKILLNMNKALPYQSTKNSIFPNPGQSGLGISISVFIPTRMSVLANLSLAELLA